MDERVAWDIYFSTLVGWQYHPGNVALGLTLEQMAELADRMLTVRRERWQPGSQAQQH